MYKGCIFDLDGTLLNTIGTIASYGNAALEKFGLAPIEPSTYKQLVGNGASTLVRRMLAQNGIKDDSLFKRVYEAYTTLYDGNSYAHTSIYDGIEELLTALRSAGLTLCVLSNKPHSATVPVIQSFFAPGTFQYVFGARDGIPQKPDPAMVNYLLKEMDISPKECIYVGDTKTDMDTGKAAGLFTVGVLWGFRAKEELMRHHADFLAAHPLDILSCLK